MVVLWNFPGISKGCLWDFHWISIAMIFLWDFSVISVGFQ
jgi:hypothetical protein